MKLAQYLTTQAPANAPACNQAGLTRDLKSLAKAHDQGTGALAKGLVALALVILTRHNGELGHDLSAQMAMEAVYGPPLKADDDEGKREQALRRKRKQAVKEALEFFAPSFNAPNTENDQELVAAALAFVRDLKMWAPEAAKKAKRKAEKAQEAAQQAAAKAQDQGQEEASEEAPFALFEGLEAQISKVIAQYVAEPSDAIHARLSAIQAAIQSAIQAQNAPAIEEAA